MAKSERILQDSHVQKCSQYILDLVDEILERFKIVEMGSVLLEFFPEFFNRFIIR